jgi:hypothetical protein
MPLYIYGLVRADDVREGFGLESGGRLPPVEVIVSEDLAAIVGQVQEPVRLQRQALLAHSDVLQEAFKRGPVLPLRYGTVVHDADALERDLIAPRRAQWTARLQALAGKGEYQLKVSYREEPLLRSVVSQDPEIQRSAQAVRGLPAEASHFQRINLGERITAAVGARREADGHGLAAQLQPLSVAVEIGALQQPTMVLNASFLVASDVFEQFDAAADRLAKQHAELMEFKLIGPMPAHSFAERDLPATATANS